MLDGLKKFGKAIGAWEDDPATAPAPAMAAPVQAPVQQVVMPAQMVGFAQAIPSVNEELYAAISTAIATGVDNNLTKLHTMAETMRAAIPDEAMRIKAAAAACGLTPEQITQTIDTLVANVAVEKNRFLTTDIAAMNSEVERVNAEIEEVKAQIEQLTAQANAAVGRRDELITQSAQKAADVQNTTAVFEATSAKILQDLELEKNKIRVYLPVGV